MTPRSFADELRQIGIDGGLDAVGVASASPFVETRRVLEERKAAGLAATMQFTYRQPDRSTDPERTLAGAKSLVVGARCYLRTAPDEATPEDGRARSASRPAGRVARYAWSDHYGPLRLALGNVAERLRAAGHRAMVLADDNALVDRAAAQRAGIGWFGNNTTLLVPGAGSWFVLGSVLTDAELLPDEPVAAGCGSCRRCLPACPTGALVEPGVLDARRCLAWLVQAPGTLPREYRQAVGDRIYGCDDCQDVCPVNRATARHRAPAPPEAGSRPTVDVLELLGSSDAEILAHWGRWYIADRKPRYLRRNALVVLGNTGDPEDPEVIAAIVEALTDADPLIRAHAAWAAARLGRTDLTRMLEGDPAAEVEDELRHLHTVAPRRAAPAETCQAGAT